MAKLTRITQPIFASTGGNDDTSVFGTMKTTPVYTTDVAQSIGSTAFTNGWKDAVDIGYAPFLEDMNTVQKAVTYQIAYGQQEGIPEWASDTTYYKGSLAKLNTANGSQIYVSLTDNNTGNLVSNNTYWKLMFDSANSYVTTNTAQTIAGEKTFSASPIVPTASSGDNSTKAASTAYVDGGLSGKQATITGAATTITGSNLTTNRALISNGSGKVAVSDTTNTELGYVHGVTSAIQTQLDNTVKLTGNQTIAGTKTFSSTIAGSINGNAATVTNGVYTNGNQTIAGTKTFSSSPVVPTPATSDNSTKAANTAFIKAQGYVPSSSFEEVAVVVESYQGTSDWYRVWSDGWIEQGGRATSKTWTFPKPFSSATSFSIVSNNSATTDGYGRPDKLTVTDTGATADSNAVTPIQWIASGK